MGGLSSSPDPWLPRLTVHQRLTLELALRAGELRRTHDGGTGAPAWPAPWQSLYSLVDRGLLEQGRRRNRHGQWMDTWKITDLGRAALVIVRRPRPVSMGARGRARTRIMVGGFWRETSMPEPEKVDPVALDPRHSRRSQALHASARGTANRPPGNRKVA